MTEKTAAQLSMQQLQDHFEILHGAIDAIPEAKGGKPDLANAVIKQATHAVLNVLEVITINLQRIADAQEGIARQYVADMARARTNG